jgi:ankyrin repeat protein
MKNKYFGIVLLILTIVSCTGKAEKDKWAKENPTIKYSEAREKEVWGRVLRGDNPALFYGTPLYDLAKALSNDSFLSKKEEIIKLIDAVPKEYINFQEEKFGTTIGQFALRTNNISPIRILLDKGLNPDLIDKSGNALIIDINHFYINPSEKKMVLIQMIKKGANVNLFSKKATTSTPLIRASQSGNLENVKILIEAGADPHFINESTWIPFNSPLNAALQGHIDVVNYLIFEQKVDFKIAKYSMDSKFHPGEYVILHNLREMFFKLDSKEYKEKMKLVAYLKTQGLDYWKTPIQERYKDNPNYTPEYLSKY